MVPLRVKYPRYTLHDLTVHPAIVYIPYQVQRAPQTPSNESRHGIQGVWGFRRICLHCNCDGEEQGVRVGEGTQEMGHSIGRKEG
eukprot:3937717-Rhodomonas_salina.1